MTLAQGYLKLDLMQAVQHLAEMQGIMLGASSRYLRVAAIPWEMNRQGRSVRPGSNELRHLNFELF